MLVLVLENADVSPSERRNKIERQLPEWVWTPRLLMFWVIPYTYGLI